MVKKLSSKDFIVIVFGVLGVVYRNFGQYDKVFGYYIQEFSIRQDMDDRRGECRVYGNFGNVYMFLGYYMDVFKCYEEQLEKVREL